jgi:hypothetical protein
MGPIARGRRWDGEQWRALIRGRKLYPRGLVDGEIDSHHRGGDCGPVCGVLRADE